jgi:opine dehydrogenase
MEAMAMAVSKNDVWTVVGVGMGGKGLLAELGINDFRLRAYDKDDAQVAGIREAKGLHVDGRAKKFGPVELATTDIKAALNGAKVILVSTNGDDHPQVARDLAPYLTDGQIIVLIQGHFGGTLIVRKALSEAGCGANVQLAEMDGYPYMMTVRSPDRVELTTYKEIYQLVALPASRSKTIVEEIGFAFPGLVAGPNLMQTGLTDLGSVFHACGIVTNVGTAEGGKPYNFYAHNMTPSVCNLIEALDRERVAVAKAYGIETPDVFTWLASTYNRREMSLYWSMQANAVTHYRYSPAPDSLSHRFLVTDVGSGLVAWSSLGKVAGVATPVIDSVVHLAGALTKRNFFDEGRNLRNLGLEGMNVGQILKFVTN